MIRICILGNTDGSLDEGMNKVTRQIYNELKNRGEVLFRNPRHLFRIKFWKKLKSFKPQIVHYIPGPTIRSLIVLKIIKCICRNVKTVSSATRPYFSKYSKLFIKYLKPDLIMTQSMRFEYFFREKNCKVKFFPNGVDCNKFSPVCDIDKIEIKKKLGLPLKNRIILHVGHFRSNRNLDIFKKIQKIENLQVVIVGNITETSDERLKKDLEQAGIMVFHKFYDDISKFYKMADLYIFPLKYYDNKISDFYYQVGAIDLPLSVLEAMACNLPVATTKFGALPRMFEEGNGLTFCENDTEIVSAINKKGGTCALRNKVLDYDWNKIGERLECIYENVSQTN